MLTKGLAHLLLEKRNLMLGKCNRFVPRMEGFYLQLNTVQQFLFCSRNLMRFYAGAVSFYKIQYSFGLYLVNTEENFTGSSTFCLKWTIYIYTYTHEICIHIYLNFKRTIFLRSVTSVTSRKSCIFLFLSLPELDIFILSKLLFLLPRQRWVDSFHTSF